MPDEVFLVWEGGDGVMRSWTYGEFDLLVARVRGTLNEAGVSKGAAVHLYLSNCPAFVALWLATTAVGAHIVPSDPSASEHELHDAIQRTLWGSITRSGWPAR
ncbi:MAG: AMP-binding protein [Streptosporangiaceae bacterium]